MTPGLLDMPEDVMSEIMKNIGIREIFTLRKVCHDLRKFIDEIQPDAKLEEIIVNEGCNQDILVRYQFPGGFHSLTYDEQVRGCSVEYNNGRNRVLLKNEDFINVSMKDFEIVLGHSVFLLKQ